MDIKIDDNFARNNCDTTNNDDNKHIQFPQSLLASSEKHSGRAIHACEHSHSEDIASLGSGVVSASSTPTSILNDMVGNEENHDHLMKNDYKQYISPDEALTPHSSSNCVDAQHVMYNTVDYEKAAAEDSRDASSMMDIQGGSTKIHFSAGETSMPEQIKEGCSTAAVQVAQPLGTDNTEKAGIVEDEASCCSESNEVTSMTVTQELVSQGTGNNSGKQTHDEIGISTYTGMLTETSVIDDQSANTSDRRGLPNSRCTTDILALETSAKMDGMDIVPETVASTKAPCDEESDPILQLPICYQGGTVNKQVVSDICVEEPRIQPANKSQPSVHSSQQNLNGEAADTASIHEDGHGHLLKNDGVPPEPVWVNSLRAEEMCITAQHSDCRAFCSETLLTKEEQAPASQESDFYLTPLAVAPQLVSFPMELECNGKSDTVSVEVFEADSHSEVNVDISCIHPDGKLEERPMNIDKVCDVHPHSVEDLENHSLQLEGKKEESQRSDLEVCNKDHQSVVDQKMPCIDCEGQLQHSTTNQVEVFRPGEQQFVIGMDTSSTASGGTLEERTINKIDQQSVPDLGTFCIEPEDKLKGRPMEKPELFEMDQQFVPDVEISCIDPEDKLEERPIDKPEVFEMDQQSMEDVGTSCIEPEDKLDERPIDKPEVFEMDQQSMEDVRTSCIEPEDKLEERPIDKPEVFEMDQQSMEDVGTSCIEPEDKLEERPIDKPEVFEMDQQSMDDVGKSYIEPEDKLEERPIDKPELFETDQPSMEDVRTACIEPEDKLKERPIDKPEVFEMDQQSVTHLELSFIESENKFEKSQMCIIESYHTDQQLVPDLEICCIEPEGKLEQKPINKTEVFEINQQLVPNVDISGIELKEKLEEISVEMAEEVYGMDQLFVGDQVISSFGSDGNLERRPVNKPEVSDVDQQSTVELTTCCHASEGKTEERSESNNHTFLIDQQLTVGHSAEETNRKHLVRKIETGMPNENPPDDGGGVAMPTLLKHSDRHERSDQDDQYTKIKSCFHTATVVQFASPLVTYIEYSNPESSCSSEDTQDAMEIVPYLHNDTISNFTFDYKSLVVDDDMGTVEKVVSDSRNAVKESASDSNGNLKHQTFSSDAVTNSDAIVMSLQVAECSTHGTNLGIGVNVHIKEEARATNKYYSCENCDIDDCNCGRNDAFETILNKQEEGKESDQQEQTGTVAEPQEECQTMRHSHSIKEGVTGCMNDLLEAVYLQIDASEMGIFRTEDVPPDATNATNVCCDVAPKDTNQQQKINAPIKNEANIMYEEMSMEIIEHLAPYDDRVKQSIAKRENECFVTTASMNGDHGIQGEADSDSESYIPSKFRKLAMGCREDMDSCHTAPATGLQENASYGDGEYRRWMKKEILTDVEDQQVPKDDAAHTSLQQEESLYRDTSPPPPGPAAQDKPMPSFQWSQAPSIVSPVLPDYEPSDCILPMLKTCQKPRRVGLSRKAHVSSLHPYFSSKAKARFS